MLLFRSIAFCTLYVRMMLVNRLDRIRRPAMDLFFSPVSLALDDAGLALGYLWGQEQLTRTWKRSFSEWGLRLLARLAGLKYFYLLHSTM